MRKIKLFLSIVLSIFFLASCSLNSTQRPANPGNDVIEPGEEGYTVTVKDFETKELIISLTKKSTNIIRFADLKLNEIEGYTITLVDEVGNPTEIEDIKHTCTLYVKYAPNTYKLSFIEQGSRVETLKVTYNENVSPIEATLIPTGYEFLGWSEKKDEYVPYTFDKMPAHNVEVYAHYQLKEYAITLETKIAALEGLANISKYHYNDRLNNFVPLELQEAIKALPKYTLVGWYIDEALTIPFENISMPACDLTLYAKWEYDGLSFVDGNNIIGIGSGSIGDPIITPTPVEKEGFQFIGWYYDEEFTNEVKPGDLITEGLQNIYAYYKPLNNVEYRVEYYLQTFGVSYTLTKTDKFSGTTGTLVNADVLAFEGFTFDQSNSNNLLQANILANGSLTLKVYYSRNAYNVVYNTYDGEYATYENIKYGDAVLKPANPSRVGYTFAGWDQEVPTLMPNNDVVLNALWTANTNTAYKVEHYIEKLDGTYELKETENLTGTTDTNAVAVSKLYSGFTFNASHASNVLEGNIEADGSRVLKVYYSRNSYTLTINVDGVENNVSYKYEEAVALPTTPTKVGYTFSTWSPEVPSTMPANNVKVVAEWQVNEYTLTINVDGVKTEVVYEYGETVEAPTDPSKDGHTFTGWSPEVPSTMPAQNLTIKATWKVNQYTITIKYDNDSEDKVITQDYDTVIEIVPDPSKTGHTFTGWITDTGVAAVVPSVMPAKDLELNATWSINEYTITIKYDNESEDKVITQDYNTNIETIENPTKVGHTFTGWDQEIPSKMPAQNLTIKATWKVNQYTITIKYDNDSEDKVITQDYDTVIEIVPDPSKTGHTFTGWVTDTGVAAVVPAVMPAKDLELNATWSINEYTITIKYDNETEDKVITQDYNTNIETIENPTKVGHTFTGWDQDIPSKMPAQNLTINATWKVNQYTITIKYDNETEDKVITQDYDSVIEIVPDPSKTGHTFTGWITDTGVAAVVPAVMPAKDLELTATWSINEYTITIKYDNESEDKVITQDYNTNIETIENPTKVGYTFTGWDQEIPSKMPAQNLTINATWEVNEYSINYDLDGGTFVKYETREEMVADFIKDFSTFSGETITTPAAYWKSGSKTSFWRDAEMYAKWSWIFEALIPYAKQQGIDLQYLNNMLANPISISGYATQNVAIYLLGINATIWNETYKATYGGLSSIYTTVDCTSEEVLNSWEDYSVMDFDTKFTIKDQITLVNPNKFGYTFLGWFDTNNQLVTNIPQGTSNDVELKAKWEANPFNITYNLDGGSFARYETREEMVDDFLADFSTFSGETITTPAAYWKSGSKTSFWRDAEMHAKWSWIFEALIPLSTAQDKDVQYLQGMLANPISISGYATQNVAIYLLGINATQWNETYEAEYGKLSSSWTTADCTSAEALENWKDYCLVDYPKTFTVVDEVTLVNPKKLGYTFLGWYDSNNNLVTSIAVGTSNDVELTAKWEAKEYTVTVDIDGVKTPYTFTYGETIEIADPTKTGHTFTGWTPSLPSTMPANNLEVAARWTIKQFTITIVYDNGNENTVITQDYNSAIEAVADPTKTGHTFAGWSQAIPSTMPAEDLTIRANWTANKYTITLVYDNGNENTVITQDYNSAIEAVVDPTKTGHTFAGWSQAIPSTMPAEDLKIRANWTVNKYTITFVVDGSEQDKEFEYGQTITAVDVSPADGYELGGWNPALPATMPAENLRVEVVWTEKMVKVTGEIDFSTDTQRTECDTNHQKWVGTNVVLTNTKTSGSSNVADAVDPVKFYAKSEVVIEFIENITRIEFVCSSSSYANALKNSATGYDVVVDGTKVTINLDNTIKTLTLTMSAQVRVKSLNIYYENTEFKDNLLKDKATLSNTQIVDSGNAIILPSGTLANGTVVGTWTATPSGFIDLETLVATATENTDVVLTTTLTNGTATEEFSITVTIVCTPLHEHTPCSICGLCEADDCDGEASEKCQGHLPEPTPVDKTVAEIIAIDSSLNMKESYYVTGTVSAFGSKLDVTDASADKFGNFILEADGQKIVVYGSTADASKLTWNNITNQFEYATSYDFLTNSLTSTIVVGSTVKLLVVRTEYNNSPQLNAIVLEVKNDSVTTIPEPTPVDKTVAELNAIDSTLEMTASYKVTGTVSAFGTKLTADDADGSKYGNFILELNGEKIVVYGATATASALVWNEYSGLYTFTNPQDFLTDTLTSTIVKGSVVELVVVRTSYNGNPQLNAIVVSVDNSNVVEPSHEHVACPTCELCTAEDCDGTEAEKCQGHMVEEVYELTKVTDLSQLAHGIKFILSYGDTNVMGAQSGTLRSNVTTTIADGKVAKDTQIQVVTLVASSDNHWLFKVSDTEYLYYSGSGNSIATGAVYDLTAQWDIAITDGVLVITNAGNSVRILQYNEGSPRFACYTSSQKKPDIYIVNNVASETHLHTVCTTCGLCVSEDCTGEESVKCQGHVAVEESVYNVTEVTDLSQLSNGSQIILYYDGKVMGAQGNGIRDIVTATISETNTIPQNGIQVVTLEAVGDGSWFLKVSDTEYLYAINDNKVYTGTEKTDAYKWKIVIESGQIKIQNVSYIERYLQYNTSSPRFACYKGTQKNPSIYLLTA